MSAFKNKASKRATNILRSGRKGSSITQSPEGNEHPTYNTTKGD